MIREGLASNPQDVCCYRARNVLDFGCGYATQAHKFLELGVNYVGTDLERRDFDCEEEGREWDFVPADQLHLCSGFDLVMASSVANIQLTLAQLVSVFEEWLRLTSPGGLIVFNYPSSPRKLPLGFAEIGDLLRNTLGRNVSIARDKAKNMFFVRKVKQP